MQDTTSFSYNGNSYLMSYILETHDLYHKNIKWIKTRGTLSEFKVLIQ